MNILIIGSTGMLGRTLEKFMVSNDHKVYSINRKDLDLSNAEFDDLYSSIKKIDNVDLIVNCAGLIPQRSGVDESDMIKVNSIIPRWLYDISKKEQIKFIQITTDCVFKADKGDYIETDPHDASDVYGMSKSLGEPKGATVIRTSIIGEEEKNKLSLFEWVRSNSGKNINGYLDHIWNGVTCLQLSKIIETIHKNDIYWEGVRHIHSNKLNKFELSSIINEVYDLDIKITPINAGLVDRSMSSIYEIEFDIPSIGEQIIEMKKFYGE